MAENPDTTAHSTLTGSPDGKRTQDGTLRVPGVTVSTHPTLQRSALASLLMVLLIVLSTAGFLVGAPSGDPVVISHSPADGASSVPASAELKVAFSELMDEATVTANTLALTGTGGVVPVGIDMPAGDEVIFTPQSPLSEGATYTVVVTGGASGVKDLAGNPMESDVSWEFTVRAPAVPRVDPNLGPGGPVLVVTGDGFGRYLPEILRAEGLNLFEVGSEADLTAARLESFSSVVLGEVPLTSGEAAALTEWVTDGGDLVAMRPDDALAGLLGLTGPSGTLSEAYLKVDTSTAPGAGIVAETMQFHGAADKYTPQAGTQVVATLYSTSTSATTRPAVTTRSVGDAGGSATAFAFDLARSVVLTRQGNPAWVNENRDGQAGPNRANDLFYGDASFDPQSGWVDLTKVEVPQADEQQRLLANILTTTGLDRMPLPRFWYLPRGEQAAVVLTEDEHNGGDVAARMDFEKAQSPVNCNVADWECIRSTVYLYPEYPSMTDAQATAFEADGFEVALHTDTECTSYSRPDYAGALAAQLTEMAGTFTGVSPSRTNRNHCIAWSDYTTVPEELAKQDIHLDTNYYYWPGEWVGDNPGLFTGSGFAQRFATTGGALIDTYQAATQMTDESGQSYPFTITTLLDNALTKGYYGAFVANQHTDGVNANEYHEATIDAARVRGVPLITAGQLLDWTDGRNASSFGDLAWDPVAGSLTFAVDRASGARGLEAMLPATAHAGGALISVVGPDGPVTLENRTVKGLDYVAFRVKTGNWTATYT